MRHLFTRVSLAVGSVLCIGLSAPTAGLAQSGGSFGGSFDTGGGGAVTQPAAPTADAGGFGGSFDSGGGGAVTQPVEPAADAGGFGGSFDSGSGSVTPAPTPTQETDVPVVGGGSFGPGSFEETTVTPQPVAPEPVVSPPQPAPPPGPPVDPQLLAFEGRDYGIPPSQQLRQGNFHAPTPTSIPGAQVVSTQVLAEALQSGQQIILIDVLGSDYGLPNAFVAPALASGGGFDDRTQQQATHWLRQITGGNSGAIIVIYCSDPMCWLSYNATLRTVAAGYGNVYWYRGGLQAWQMAGLPLYPTSF